MDYASYWEELGIGELQKNLTQCFPDMDLRLEEIFKLVLQADLAGAGRMLVSRLRDSAAAMLYGYKNIFLWLVAIGLLTALVTRAVELFEMKQVAQLCFCFLYFTIAFVLLKVFGEAQSTAAEALKSIVVFVKLILPAYLLSIGVSVGNLSAGLANQILVLGIYIVEQVLCNVLLPAIYCLMLLAIAGGVCEEEKLALTVRLLERGFQYALKAVMWLMTGITIFQSMISPLLDTAKNTVLEKVLSALPGVGNGAEAAFELVVGSALFMKRCLGTSLMFFLICLCAVPVLKIGMIVLVLKVSAAIMGIVSDRRVAGIVNRAGDTCAILWKLLGIGLLLFLVALAVTAAAVRG